MMKTNGELSLYLSDKKLTRLCLEDGNTFVTQNFDIQTSSKDAPKLDDIIEHVQGLSAMVGKDVQVSIVAQSIVETMREMMATNQTQEKSPQKTTELGERLMAVCQSAVDLNASDIHIEIYREQTRYLMRVDGERELLSLFHNNESAEHRPRDEGVSLISYVFSTLGDKDVKLRDPANDRFELALHWQGEPKFFEWRAALIPLNRGVKLTLRCLTPRDKPLNIDDMDLPTPYVKTLRKYLQKRNGGIVICGPVGSGKSTLANGLLCEIDSIARSVHCMEDPVEFELPFVCKTTVEPDKEIQAGSKMYRAYAFYTKATLRHDVDVALIGEVRDNAAALQFCRKGEVGGLAITTLHTNSAYGVPQTFIESLGVPAAVVGAPDLMLMFVHQRLVKKLCDCALPFEADNTASAYEKAGLSDVYHTKRQHITQLFYQEIKAGKKPKSKRSDECQGQLYQPSQDVSHIRFANPIGCNKCDGKGERGRLSVIEIIVLEAEDRRLIAKNDIHGWLAHLEKLNWPDISAHTRSRIKKGQVDVTSAAKQIDSLLPQKSNTVYQQMQEAL
ncbi:MAG: Flp pilus assembly complex ATPase component TadA [Psychrosphaera sp.]|nr:Flp pilus assembly complex ATPase component TadA [Psychrosphaera sp.]